MRIIFVFTTGVMLAIITFLYFLVKEIEVHYFTDEGYREDPPFISEIAGESIVAFDAAIVDVDQRIQNL